MIVQLVQITQTPLWTFRFTVWRKGSFHCYFFWQISHQTQMFLLQKHIQHYRGGNAISNKYNFKILKLASYLDDLLFCLIKLQLWHTLEEAIFEQTGWQIKKKISMGKSQNVEEKMHILDTRWRHWRSYLEELTAKLRVRVHGTTFKQSYLSRTHRSFPSDIQPSFPTSTVASHPVRREGARSIQLQWTWSKKAVAEASHLLMLHWWISW